MSCTPIVLLHGLGGTAAVWRPVIPLLSPHHEVHAPTLPGHHGGPPLPHGTVDGILDALEDTMDAAGLDRAHVVGNSLGGRLALELARRGRARSVVAFSPAAACQTRGDLYRATMHVWMAFAAARWLPPGSRFVVGHARARRMLLGRSVARPEALEAEQLADALAGVSGCAAAGSLLRDLLRLADIEPLDGLDDVPVVIAWPERDRVISFERYGRPVLLRVPAARCVRLAGVGHVPMSDDPALVARTILDVTRAAGRRRRTA